MKKKLIVDVDSTLWEFDKPFFKFLSAFNDDVPTPDKWEWDTPSRYDNFFDVVNHIHFTQLAYPPFDDAKYFLDKVKEHFYIIIASHRKDKFKDTLIKWLNNHKLYYDEVHVSRDKSVLFNDAFAIVDDCPSTLEKAYEQGIIPLTITYNWNKHCGFAGGYGNLTDIGEVLLCFKKQEEINRRKQNEMPKV